MEILFAMPSKYAQLMNTLHSIVSGGRVAIRSEGDRKNVVDQAGAIIKSIFILCIANFFLIKSVDRFGSVKRSMKSHGTQINIIAAPREWEREREGASFFKLHTQKTTSLQLELKTRSMRSMLHGTVAPVTLRVAARASQIKCKNRSIKQSIESLQSLRRVSNRKKRFSQLRAASGRDQWESRFARIIINKFNIFLIADSIFVVVFFFLFLCTFPQNFVWL